jgi:PAS domain S-box-containing protein
MEGSLDSKEIGLDRIRDSGSRNLDLDKQISQFEGSGGILEESEILYRSIVDGIEIGIAVISPAMEILSLNNQMRKWFPHVDASVHFPCHRIFNYSTKESTCPRCPTYRTLRDGKVHRSITSSMFGGKVKYFKITAQPLKDKRGKVIASIEMIEDITRKKRAAELLRKEKKKLFSILQKAPYGAVIIDRGGTYLYVNEAFSKITGYDLEDVPKGADWFRKAYPDSESRQAATRAWKEDLVAKDITRTFSIRCKGGKEKVIEFRPTRLNEDSFLLMLSDVTEVRRAEWELRKAHDELETRVRERTGELIAINKALEKENAIRSEVEEALKEREASLTAIIEASDGLIYTCSKDFKVEFMNERLVKRTGYDARGEYCYKVLHGLDSVCPWCVNEQVFQGQTVRWELRSPKDDRWWYIINTPIYHADGSISKYSMILDITERKEIEEEIRRLNRSLEENIVQLRTANAELETFSYSISHDLKTPIIAVEGFSRILLERHTHQLDEKGRRFLRMIDASAQQMRELVEDLLAFYTVGRKQLKLSSIDMGKMVGEVFDQLKGANPGRTMQLNIRPSPGVNADKTMIRQVVLNLLSNAIKFSRTRTITDIEFGGWAEPGRIVCYTRDNGIGFPMDQERKLFEVFERLRASDEYEGTGVGLATVKRIITRHGGEVWAQSKVNEGATFFFSIPSPS